MPIVHLPLTDSADNPLAFDRIVGSHGLAGVTPWRRLDGGGLSVAVRLGGRPELLSIRSIEPNRPGAEVLVSSSSVDGSPDELVSLARRLLGLGRDLTPFLERASSDRDLDWAAEAGAGAMARGQTVFEDVMRTVLTTNCSWSATVKMCDRLTDLHGDFVVAESDRSVKAFPTAEAIASLTPEELKEGVRVGYRAERMIELARTVADGDIDLEELGAGGSDLPDAEVERRLLSLPGLGPYATAHVMLLIGRPALPILDSWTRPRYERVTGRRATDAQIRLRVMAYGTDSGLALWLILTRDWFADGAGG
ncbi:MAG: hypothetical protein WCO96_00285 [Actinomycetes bacterium]